MDFLSARLRIFLNINSDVKMDKRKMKRRIAIEWIILLICAACLIVVGNISYLSKKIVYENESKKAKVKYEKLLQEEGVIECPKDKLIKEGKSIFEVFLRCNGVEVSDYKSKLTSIEEGREFDGISPPDRYWEYYNYALAAPLLWLFTVLFRFTVWSVRHLTRKKSGREN